MGSESKAKKKIGWGQEQDKQRYREVYSRTFPLFWGGSQNRPWRRRRRYDGWRGAGPTGGSGPTCCCSWCCCCCCSPIWRRCWRRQWWRRIAGHEIAGHEIAGHEIAGHGLDGRGLWLETERAGLVGSEKRQRESNKENIPGSRERALGGELARNQRSSGCPWTEGSMKNQRQVEDLTYCWHRPCAVKIVYINLLHYVRRNCKCMLISSCLAARAN